MAGYYGGYMGNEAGMQTGLMAGAPSFEISPGGAGDARRSRKGLTPQDVDRLIQANPQFEKQIREMYLPGPSLPGAGGMRQAFTPAGSSNLPNAINNMSSFVNDQFYGGPQLGQLPAGFQNKFVS